MKIIAVTSCPVGMAHTYMAAAALKKYAKKNNYEIKVETQGAMGIQNRLNETDIYEADLLINAADVAMQDDQRFEKVLTYKTSTSKLIKKTEKTMAEAIALIQG